MRLYSTKEVAEILNVSTQTIKEKTNRLGLRPYKVQGTKSYFYDNEQLYQIKAMQVENYRVEIIHHTQTFWIIPSKMNYE